MLTTSEYPQMFRFFDELEKRFNFVDRIAEMLELNTPASIETIENTFVEKLAELDEAIAKQGTNYNGELKELRNFWDQACNSLGTMEDSLIQLESDTEEANREREALGHSLDQMDQILDGMESLENSK